jgi:hypothetical protein
VFAEEAVKALYRAIQIAVTIAHAIVAVLYFAFGLLCISVGIWLLFVFGFNWWAVGFGAFLILCGASPLLRGGEIFLSTRPAERPDDRLRYLRSRSLYVPEDRRETGRRERSA